MKGHRGNHLVTDCEQAANVAKTTAEACIKMGASLETQKNVLVLSMKKVLIDHMAKLRISSGLTQAELAKRMNVHVNKVVAIESLDDQEKLTLGELRQYVEGLGLKSVVRIERRTDIRTPQSINKG